ncbi:MAG TPA: hypothetical protein VJ811_18470 [Sphingopyxis sp.]|nr:hypothetical protein [Sphingopyxis sp.]
MISLSLFVFVQAIVCEYGPCIHGARARVERSLPPPAAQAASEATNRRPPGGTYAFRRSKLRVAPFPTSSPLGDGLADLLIAGVYDTGYLDANTTLIGPQAAALFVSFCFH